MGQRRQHATERRPAVPRRPIAIAAVLTFLWPGLGQLYQRRPTLAKVFALPVIPIVIFAVLLLVDGVEAAALRLFDPTLSLIVFWVVVGIAVWRLLALGEHVIHAGGPTKVRRLELAIVLALSVLVVETHGIVANIALSFHDAGTAIFDSGGPGPSPGPGFSFAPGESGPTTAPFATPETRESRINVLLIGVDSATYRTQALTDTMIVASIDPKTKGTSMVSFPRDLAQFKLFDGGTYNGKINSLLNWASGRPQRFPDGGTATLMREVGYLLGIPIHYYASINLDGFVKLVDAMGYVTITNPRAIDDFAYGGWTDGRPIGFHLAAGVHNLNGQEALAYARSRKGLGDSDFTRAGRQQELLLAVRRRLSDPTLLPRLPQILEAISQTLRTNFPPDRLGEMLILARQVDDAGTRRVVLGPPYSVHPPTSETGGTYILRLRSARVAALSVELYGEDSAFWTASVGASPSPAP